MNSAFYSLRSFLEWRILSVGFHGRAGATSSFKALQIEPTLRDVIAQFLLEPPQIMADRFLDLLTGPAVELKEGRQTACFRRGADVTRRSHMASAGAIAVDAGLVRWTARCSGHSFAVGVISEARWHALEKDSSLDWPFVGQGVGQGYGIVSRRGSLYISRQSPANDWWNSSGEDDYAIPSPKASGTQEFSVVLDLDRARIFFEQDGAKIYNSDVELTELGGAYRFIASVPDRGCLVTIVGN